MVLGLQIFVLPLICSGTWGCGGGFGLMIGECDGGVVFYFLAKVLRSLSLCAFVGEAEGLECHLILYG